MQVRGEEAPRVSQRTRRSLREVEMCALRAGGFEEEEVLDFEGAARAVKEIRGLEGSASRAGERRQEGENP